MSDTTRFRESRTAEQMAAALRQAHAARRHELPDPDEAAASLRALGDLERIPAVARAGPAALPIKAARAVLRVLLRPWTAVQTQANHEVARRISELSASAHDIARRVPQVEDSVVHLDRRLRSLEGRPGGLELESRAPVDLARLEYAFVQMHLGPAPARVLVLAPQPRFATELAAFGFDVSWVPPSSPSPSPPPYGSEPAPGVQLLEAADVPPAAFDVVVRLPDPGAPPSTTGALAATALRNEGRLLGAWRGSEAHPWPDPVIHGGMHVEIAMCVERTAAAWHVRTAAEDPRDWEGAESILLHARRFDAPGG